MVFYFTSSEGLYVLTVGIYKLHIGHIIYMGKDKYENETLLKWGWPEDIW